jgi:hypothetical protein
MPEKSAANGRFFVCLSNEQTLKRSKPGHCSVCNNHKTIQTGRDLVPQLPHNDMAQGEIHRAGQD